MTLERTFLLNERLTFFVSHLLVASMMVCVAAGVIQFAHRMVPEWRGEYLLLVAMVVSFEAMYTGRIMRRVSDLLTSDLVYRLIEIVVLLVFIKGIIYVFQGFDRLAADLLEWNNNFFESFFTGEYVFVLLVAFVVWILSGWFGSILTQLEGDKFLLHSQLLDGLISDRAAARQSLAAAVFTLGFFLVMMTSLIHLDMQVVWGDRPLPRWGVFNVILYFIFSIALLSMTQFASRRASWAWEQIPISQNLARNWFLYSLVLLVVVAAVAFVLPTRYSLGFLATLGYIFNLFATTVYFVIFLVITPFLYLISLIFSRLAGTEVEGEMEGPELTLPQVPMEPGVPIPWLELLRSILFWLFLIGLVGYAFYQYARQNEELLRNLRKLPGWIWLTSLLAAVLERLRGWNRQAGLAVRARVRRIFARQSEAGPGRIDQFISLRRLSSRQKVLFYYLALLKRGSEAGLPRRPSQTPHEYAQMLKSSLSTETEPQTVEQDIESLTEAFMEARYSRHEITHAWAERVKRLWNHLRRVLRRRKPSPDA